MLTSKQYARYALTLLLWARDDRSLDINERFQNYAAVEKLEIKERDKLSLNDIGAILMFEARIHAQALLCVLTTDTD
jgi:hypothetical protein